MSLKIPPYTVTETYEDDPHWNSGFWETHVLFEGEENPVPIYRRKAEVTESYIKEVYVRHLTSKAVRKIKGSIGRDVFYQVKDHIEKGETKIIINLELTIEQ